MALASAMSPTTIAIPTNDGARAVGTAMAFVDAARARGRSIDVCIADDGDRGADVAGLRSHVAGAGGRLCWVDRAAKLRLLEALVAAGCDREVVSFALLDPLRIGRRTGANRNAIQLACRGTTLSVDDDIVPRVHAVDPIEEGVAVLAGDPTECWFFAEEADARATVLPDRDPFLALEEGLALASPPGRPRIVAAWMGVVGDPGTPSGLYLLTQADASQARLAPDDARYVAHRESRLVMHAVVRTTVCSGAGWSPGIVAYDHRAILPPFTPVLRGEGLVWGATIDAGGAWSLVRVPGALEHRIDAPNRHERGELLAIAASMAGNTIVQHAVVRARGREPVSSPARALAVVAAGLRELARTPATFVAFVAEAAHERATALRELLGGALERSGHVSTSWARDVEQTMVGLARMQTAGRDFVPYDLVDRAQPVELLRSIVLHLAELFDHWPTMLEAASSIDMLTVASGGETHRRSPPAVPALPSA